MKQSSGSITTGRASGLLTLAVGALFYSSGSCARPDLQPLGPNIADKGSAFYHFTQRQYDSVDGARHYRVWTAVPNKAPPAAGYPVLYMLDGNAVMDKLSDAFLQQLSAGSPPVIVAIGYQTALPFDTAARAWDYTPPLKTFTPRTGKPAPPPRKTGGNYIFRQLLTETMVPQAEANLKIDPRQRALWGHSYGGLFVLDAWRNHSLFRIYYSASPSLGQAQTYPLKDTATLDGTAFTGTSLYLLEGDGKAAAEPSGHEASLGVLRQTQRQLAGNGLTVQFWRYPGLTHGQMFDVSLRSALLHLSGQPPLAHQ
ncbi:alpha/beta hydrolase [Klebsiella quasivariicola]|uniref:alpha/beta hydrolase n=1 Tax=Klebsiella TaxID=570 RepID=UPI0004719101|nr:MULTISPECIES: alpha/beta hydrolase-fold protein [Klebsiella]NBZ76063.1 Salmochelin siderophore protein IroE [Klebsiella quasivariicola]TTN49917.1 alpha/beta hydrolase [Klebsiella quasivariicola]UDC36845.1 alpha/beta hydrolase [Klebsiella quasivariicola]SLO22315.1 hydrolase [Klebsiella quasivariicola]VAN47261.1 putative oxidoreductase, Fe-S subunit [Klebsiella quasivariicola]